MIIKESRGGKNRKENREKLKVDLSRALNNDLVGLQPTVIASRAPHLLLEQSVMTSKNRGRASPVNNDQAFLGPRSKKIEARIACQKSRTRNGFKRK